MSFLVPSVMSESRRLDRTDVFFFLQFLKISDTD